MVLKKKVTKKKASIKDKPIKERRTGRGRGSAGKDGLTDRARKAIHIYISDPRKSQVDAYMEAYKVSRYTATGNASKLFCTPAAKAYMDELRASIKENFKVDLHDIVREYAIIAFSDLGDVCTWDADAMTLKSSKELTEHQRKAISEVAIRETAYGKNVSVKLYDKPGALRDISKIMGYLNEKVQVEPGDKLMEFLAQLPATLGPPSERKK